MSLLTVAELKAQIRTSLLDAQIQAVIDREESEIIRRLGAHYVDGSTTVTETLAGYSKNLYLKRRVSSITSVREYLLAEDTVGTLLTTTDYRLWPLQGRLQRLPATSLAGFASFGIGGSGGWRWGAIVDVAYVPADDNDLRKAAIIDLCRLALEKTAMKSESVGGEYSYTAPDWTAERAAIIERLGFRDV